MPRIIAILVGAALLAACETATKSAVKTNPTETVDPDAIQIMVLGTWHMKPSGADVANVDAESVLTPERQRELAMLVDALMAFKPTAVAVERTTDAPEYVDPNYEDFNDAVLAENPNERAQIGYRLAALAGLDVVYGVDEQPSKDEPDYFPFGKLVDHANANGLGDMLKDDIAMAQAMTAAFSKRQSKHTIPELLMETNGGEMSRHNFYYGAFKYDIGEAQPGAELQAYWFMRNAKIFSKLLQVVAPGDRVVLVYGAGHYHWLKHMAAETPGVVFIDSTPYLKAAATSLDE